MKFLILCFILSGCSISQCPVDIGDRVQRRIDGEKGVVVSIDEQGGWTKNCGIAVQYEDGTLTEDFVYNWAFVKL